MTSPNASTFHDRATERSRVNTALRHALAESIEHDRECAIWDYESDNDCEQCMANRAKLRRLKARLDKL